MSDEARWRGSYTEPSGVIDVTCAVRRRPFGLRCVSAPGHADVLHTDSTGARWASEDDPRAAHKLPTMDE